MSGKKKRMSMLDNLAAASTSSPAAAGGVSNNRALRSARDAVDGHRVWDLDPVTIEDGRLTDRLNPDDVLDLRDAIESNGQTVPILVRRHPTISDRYLLVYGRRRLEAIRLSEKVEKVRALVANLDEHSAIQAQISENMARRDLSFIEKAMFSKQLIENDFGNQSQVAEVLTVTKSSISMALAIVDLVGVDLIRAIGAAHGIGRPRWEALGKSMELKSADTSALIRIADDIFTQASVAHVIEVTQAEDRDVSLAAFEAVEVAVSQLASPGLAAQNGVTKAVKTEPPKAQALMVSGVRSGAVKRTAKGISISLNDSDFATWVEAQAQELIEDLHTRWLQREED